MSMYWSGKFRPYSSPQASWRLLDGPVAPSDLKEGATSVDLAAAVVVAPRVARIPVILDRGLLTVADARVALNGLPPGKGGRRTYGQSHQGRRQKHDEASFHYTYLL